MNILIKNINIVNENKIFTGNILIIDSFIHDISENDIDISNIDNIYKIDGSNKYAFPGIIDDQVHFREPGLTHKADIYTESKAAVAGGVTSFMDMPNVNPQTTTIDELNKKIDTARKKSLANFSFYFGATNDNIDEIKKIDKTKTCGVKVFMGSSTGNMLVDNKKSLEKIFKESPLLIATHCEDEKTIIKNTNKYKEIFGDDIPFSYHPKIRTDEACYLSSSLAVDLAKKHNTRLHLLHLTTKKEMDLLENNTPSKNKKITAEVCVHHLWFDENDYDKYQSKIKCNPAIKSEEDKTALFDAMLNDKIDVIATDHAPHLLTEKENKYFNSPSGVPLVQHSFQLMLEFYHQNKISLEKIADKMAHKPAEIFNINKRGFIRKNYFADITIVDINNEYAVNKNNILYKCKWSPFEGYTFKSKITHTIINGNIVFENGQINENFRGQQLTFDR